MDVGKDSDQFFKHQAPLDTSAWALIGGVMYLFAISTKISCDGHPLLQTHTVMCARF